MAWEKVQIWATPKFKKFLYERKAKDYTKTLFEIQEDIMKEVGYVDKSIEKTQPKNNKNVFGGGFFGKI